MLVILLGECENGTTSTDCFACHLCLVIITMSLCIL